MRALLIFSGTYPYHHGGVSSWAQNLISGLREVEFDALSVVASPHLKLKYSPPLNLKHLYTLPLGAEHFEEYLEGFSFWAIASRRRRTSKEVIEERFIPALKTLLDYLLGSGTPEEAGKSLGALHTLFKNYDYEKMFESEEMWRFFKNYLFSNPIYAEMSLLEIIETLRLLSRFMRPLAMNLGKYDLIHSTMAGFSGLVAVALKAVHGTPYLLTEHGIFYRERVLDFVHCRRSYPYRSLWSRIFKRVAMLNYYWADKITSVTSFNREWELALGANSRKLEVIYNGVDVRKFRPMPERVERWAVVSVTRLDYFKDPLNLIRAMSRVVDLVPRARCYIYGPIGIPEYAERCEKEILCLGLEGRVKLMGFTPRPWEAYNRGWVIVLPSMSEGTPMAVLEAMACGRPVVATDVGGVAEALGDAGLVVPVKNSKALADAIVKILLDEELARTLAWRARERAARLFSMEKMVSEYRRVYRELGARGSVEVEDRLTGEASA